MKCLILKHSEDWGVRIEVTRLSPAQYDVALPKPYHRLNRTFLRATDAHDYALKLGLAPLTSLLSLQSLTLSEDQNRNLCFSEHPLARPVKRTG
jgi:hypothetical protein